MNKDVIGEWIGTIICCGNNLDVYLVDFKLTGQDELGSIISTASRIYLTREQSPKQMLISLIHELLHAIAQEHQLFPKDDLNTTLNTAEEKIVEGFDSPVVNDLILNENNKAFFKRVLEGNLINQNDGKE